MDGKVETLDANAANNRLPSSILLRPHQAATLCNTSPRTWRSWNASGKIPRAIRLGRSTFWHRKELEDWAAAGCPDRVVWESMQKL